MRSAIDERAAGRFIVLDGIDGSGSITHGRALVEALLAHGVPVVPDRYDRSTLAHQSATAPGGSAESPWLREINRRACRSGITQVFDVDAGVAEARRSLRGERPELFERRVLWARLASIQARAEARVPGEAVPRLGRGRHVRAGGRERQWRRSGARAL